MRLAALPFGIVFLLLPADAALAQPGAGSSIKQDQQSPTEVAMVDEGAKGMLFRHFPTGLRLYISDRDPAGGSVCYLGCDTIWLPVKAPDGARPVGDWTIVVRTGGGTQWAYKGKPVYVRIHDTPDAPAGDGDEGGVWHLLK